MIDLAPSILSADFKELGKQIKTIENYTKYVHVDVMDGNFVPSISFGMPVIKSIRKDTQLIFDTHLMVDEPIRFVDDFKNSGADILTVHSEACKHLDRTLNYIKQTGMKAGVAINPATPICMIEHVLHICDLVLVMSVNPGFGGQSFIPYCAEKLSMLDALRKKHGYKYRLEVDGGINDTTINTVLSAGADLIVIGSALFSNLDEGIVKYSNIIRDFK